MQHSEQPDLWSCHAACGAPATTCDPPPPRPLPACLQGQYFRRKSSASTVLSFVAPLLEEPAEALAPYRQASQQHAVAAEQAAAAATAAATAAAAEAEAEAGQAAVAAEQRQDVAQGAPERQIGVAGPPPQRPRQQEQQQEGLVASDGSDGDEEAGGAAAAVIGPAFPPPSAAAAAAAGVGRDEGQDAEAEAADEKEEDAAAGRRAAGPAMPPAEWLAAAAQVRQAWLARLQTVASEQHCTMHARIWRNVWVRPAAHTHSTYAPPCCSQRHWLPLQMEYPVSEEEGEETAAAADEFEDEFLIGPPPPEIAEELDLGE